MNPTSSLINTPTLTSEGKGTSASLPTLDSQDFLKLLVTQLQHQDPLSPADPGDTVQQLAALSQVSTLQEINASLKTLLSSKDSSTDPASWIGLSALVPSSTALPLTDGTYAGEILINNSAGLDITFTDSSGAVVHTQHVAGTAQGPAGFSWDGLVNDTHLNGPLKITATTGSGSPVSVAVWTKVGSVRDPVATHTLIETPLGSFAKEAVLDLRA